jgi:hypothetical protein
MTIGDIETMEIGTGSHISWLSHSLNSNIRQTIIRLLIIENSYDTVSERHNDTELSISLNLLPTFRTAILQFNC